MLLSSPPLGNTVRADNGICPQSYHPVYHWLQAREHSYGLRYAALFKSE